MIRRFCDACDTEIATNVVSERPRGDIQLGGVTVLVEVMSGVGTAINAGDLCRNCLALAAEAMLRGHRRADINRAEPG